jgi:uncharacterized protein (TIGR03437 family)
MRFHIYRILFLSVLICTLLRADSAYVVTAGGSFGILDFSARTYTALGSNSVMYGGLGFDSKDNLYSVEQTTGRFFKLNPANGNGTVVGSGTGFANFLLTSLTSGALYEIDFNTNLVSINPVTGVGTVLGKIGLPFPSGQDASGLAGGVGILYYIFNDPTLPDPYSSLYIINPGACCAAQRIGYDTQFNAIGGLAFVNGTLYGFDNVSRNVLKIDTAKGSAAALFPYPGALATDTVVGGIDVALGQRLPGRLSAGAPGGQIIEFNTDGSNGFNLAPYDNGPYVQTASLASQPSVATNGTVAFSSSRAGKGSRVYVMNGDGTNVRQITFADSTGADDNYPVISPDGTKVAFVSRRAVMGKNQYQKIFVVNADGTGLRQVDPFTVDSNGNTQDSDEAIAWSPNSGALVFRAVRYSNICNPKSALAFQDIVGTINLDGTGEKDLACDSAPHGSSALDWSPDGTLIAFSRSTDLGDPAVAIIDTNGVTKYSLTAAQVGTCGTPHCIHFSPDNTRLAFPVSSAAFNGVGIINLDGTGRSLAANITYAPDNLWWAAGPAIPAPAKMTLAPDPVQVWPGHAQQLTASLLDAGGNVITHGVTGFASKGGLCEIIDATGLASVDPSKLNNVANLAAVNGGLTSNIVEVDCLAQAPSCTYSLSATSQGMDASGGANSVNVLSQGGCTWTAVSNVPWITITAGASGSGNGAVSYSVIPNTGSARSGTLTIAGVTFTVNQGAVPPVVNNNGVVNNASYALASNSVAPGSIAAIFGINLTDGRICVAASNCFPTFGSNGLLNTSMVGTQVTVNGIPAPIFYASPVQLGIQIPAELTGTTATLQVSVGGQPGPSQTIQIGSPAPGIFTQTQDGKGPAAITHVDGSTVTSANPASVGELVIIYATGLGPATPGAPTGGLPTIPSGTVSPVTVTIGGIDVVPDFAGLAGCCVGLNQINVRVPTGIVPNFLIPVVLSVGGKTSQMTTIALQ